MIDKNDAAANMFAGLLILIFKLISFFNSSHVYSPNLKFCLDHQIADFELSRYY